MIKINVSKNRIEIIGHSDYDILGKDIVCSSVSSIVTTTINGILSIDNNAIYYEYKNDKMIIEVKKSDEVIIKLINNMLDLLRSLESNYPKNIMIKESV